MNRQGVMRILGVDPGTQITGYGLIESDGTHTTHLAHGNIKLKGDDLYARIGDVFNQLSETIALWQPQVCAIEDVFVSRNASSALKLGQARGAAICAAHRAGIVATGYSTRYVKLCVTGRGGADKTQVQGMVKMLLCLADAPPTDAADALAVAICHAYSQSNPQLRSESAQ